MAQAKPSSNNQSSAREFKHRVLTCLNKLSDRDTHSAAATELESIAKTLNHDSISPFLSSISATDSSDKSPVRKQCVRLISTLSEAHGDALSSHLSKLLSAVIRRLRDPDTAVRSACVAATGSIASHVTKPPFTSVAKPLVDALVTEQELNSQIGVALCLASAVDGAPDPEPVYLRRMLPRIEKLLKCDSFKAKSALLTLLASVIGVGAASSPVIVRNLVNVLVEFVAKSEDWSARKAAAEALEKLAVVETDLLPEYKTPCLKTFEAKKFDKVKSVRETMTQMIEAWKAIPDLPEEVLTPPESQASSKGAEVASDGRYPARTPQTASKRSVPKGGSSTTTTSRRVSLENTTKKTGPAMFRKLDRKKPNNPKLSITAATPVSEDPNRFAKPETKQSLFNEETHESEYQNARLSSTVVGSNVTEDINNSHKDGEELSLIRNQLVQIETQQSNLVDLLQKFMGRSESGMVSLERRVHGLESTLEEISFDLARSTGRLSNPNPEHTKTVCCRLPGAQYLASKLWKKTEIHDSNGRVRYLDSCNQENRGFHFRRQGLIKNPLAEVRHGKSEVLCVGV
ncbi:unnamed protein product [Lactuca saligna]|uniref:TORTIFOLIA1/SINE1-2 N-terminal domain-containing protein n=1 Tax=Lactuca saligna TaxID=75948 RepID=A0AA35YUX0_LACSI|nr:unnamed protein product [Lactuca saligna]